MLNGPSTPLDNTGAIALSTQTASVNSLTAALTWSPVSNTGHHPPTDDTPQHKRLQFPADQPSRPASPGSRAEQPEPAWRGELDPHHVLAAGEPHRPDARTREVATQLVHEDGYQPHPAGRGRSSLATGYYQVSGTERDAGAGTRGTVTERHDGDRPPRRQLRQCQQEPGIDLPTL